MSRPTDQELDVSVAAMLRGGVSLAALIVLAGGILLLRHPWMHAGDFTHFEAGSKELTTLKGIIQGVRHAQPQSIVQLGLVVLIATPVARVVLCVVGFARQRNVLYVVVSLLVLIILIYSLTKGGH